MAMDTATTTRSHALSGIQAPPADNSPAAELTIEWSPFPSPAMGGARTPGGSTDRPVAVAQPGKRHHTELAPDRRNEDMA
ncbi:hypothetical protein GCM10010521_01640 [Streptomyces rameus]|uniref:Uncharacterized protein n=1 Tax=Streptomyces rameus TaxID=68261 RepID=A0ABP6MKJ0_9ACTN